MYKKIIFISIYLLLILNLSACSDTNIKPWEREQLSKKEMRFNSEKINSAMQSHFYYSKEGSSGGQGFSGGGCGCN